jgi:hypothetical protein
MKSNIIPFKKYLHPLIYVVADKPTKHNVDPNVPLVGTASYKKLLEWMGYMSIDVTRLRLFNQIDNPFATPMSRGSLNKAIELHQIRVLALGQNAASYLNKAGIRQYFLLPHPSGKNRLLNNPEFVNMKLDSCKNYIYQGVLDDEQQSTKKGPGVEVGNPDSIA